MAKTGRNDPCPCDSGKKYKRCCLEKDATSEREQRERHLQDHHCQECGADGMVAGFVTTDDALLLDEMSNGVPTLIRAGKLDEAERAAHRLLERFPDTHDGHDRLGMVYEARGEPKNAADCYRKVIELVRENKDDYDPAFTDTFDRLIERLDPSPGTEKTS
jgi:tetratricopeptide (TPR) repeat protein